MSRNGDARLAASTVSAAAAAIEALRARGAARLDPVRWAHIEALARRAASHEGAPRQVLDSRLVALTARCAAAVDRADDPSPTSPPWPGPARTGETLASLLAHINAQARGPDEPPAAASQAQPELKAIRDFGSTWSRLRVDQRLTQSRAGVPDNAGPLNTQRLLHQALSAMGEASPEYLHRFMSHVEALLWLDQASMPSAPGKKAALPGTGAGTKKPARGQPL